MSAPPAWEGRAEGEGPGGGRTERGFSEGSASLALTATGTPPPLLPPLWGAACLLHLREGSGLAARGAPCAARLPAGRPPLLSVAPAAGPLTCPPAGASGGIGRRSESVPAPGPGGRPAPLRVWLGRKPFSDLRKRYLRVSSSDPRRCRSPGAPSSPRAWRGRTQLPPSAPGVAAAPACGRMAGGCQVPPSPAGRGDLNSVLRPGSTVYEVRGALLFSFPLFFPCISHPHQDSVPVARGFLQGSFYLDPS